MDNQICIAKKVSLNNVEFLDFGIDENDKLITFDTFKTASEFLKTNVGTGEELLDYIITTTEAQSSNPRMQELLAQGVAKFSEVQEKAEEVVFDVIRKAPEIAKPEEVECMFVLECDNYEIYNNQIIYDKINNRSLVPVLAFVDQSDPSKPAEVPNFKLKNVFVDKFSS